MTFVIVWRNYYRDPFLGTSCLCWWRPHQIRRLSSHGESSRPPHGWKILHTIQLLELLHLRQCHKVSAFSSILLQEFLMKTYWMQLWEIFQPCQRILGMLLVVGGTQRWRHPRPLRSANTATYSPTLPPLLRNLKLVKRMRWRPLTISCYLSPLLIKWNSATSVKQGKIPCWR